MTLELTRYQVQKPYPALLHVQPDRALAQTMMQAYSGQRSELTTVLQYNYHALRCQRKYGEIAQTMRGIFHVETLHLQMVGECIVKLGGNPWYNLPMEGRAVPWQAGLVEYQNTPEAMLMKDLEGEKSAAQFYRQMSEMVLQKDISRLMARLAEDEEYHVKLLTTLADRYWRQRGLAAKGTKPSA